MQVTKSETMPRRKTVTEMLVSESSCILDMTLEAILEHIKSSVFLEDDRKVYLEAKLPRTKIGILYLASKTTFRVH